MQTKPYCDEEPNNPHCIVRDGQRVHVSMSLMDSACCDDCETVHDAERDDANRRQLAAAKAHADAVQRWADHFAGRRDGHAAAEREADNNRQGDYEQRIANAWQNPAQIPTGA